MNFVIRQLFKNPGFTVVAVLTLALGIGANTAIFSIVHGLLLKPLPYPEPGQLVAVWERDSQHGIDQERVSGPDYLDWREQNTVFSEMGVCPGWDGVEDFNLVLGTSVTKIRATYSSSSLFATLGTKPLLGRTLLPDEDRPQGNPAAVLGYAAWQRYFGGNSNVLGQTFTLDTYGRRDYTIVGVMPPGFGVPSGSELWLPLGWMGVTLTERRSAHWHNVIARLKPGVTPAQACLEMSAIQTRLKQAYPGETIGTQVSVEPLLSQALGRSFRTALWALWGVVTGVLLIACANVANLSLARAAGRQREIALRLALGASRWRVIRQLLGESVALALLGGGFGALLGWWGVHLFQTLCPADIARVDQLGLDSVALCFTAGISVLTGILFGLAPAWQFSRPDLNETLKQGTRGATGGLATARTRNVLVIAEVALSVVLLCGAGLMIQSFANMLRAERGFQPNHLLTAHLDFSVSGFTTWVRPTATRPQVPLCALMEQLRANPGVQFVGAASRLPRKENEPPSNQITIFGRSLLSPEEQPKADFTAISPGWVQALGARVIAGRDFTENDKLEAPGVVLINQTLARRFFPNENPIGQRLRMGREQPLLNATNVWGLSQWSEIVGVVSDVKSLSSRPEVVPEVYTSYWQWPMQGPTLFLRTTIDPATLAESIRRETKRFIPSLPTPSVRTMDHLISETLAQARLQSGLVGFFAGTALVLAAVGLYGVLAYMVSQRRQEIGIRMALGAQKHHVLELIVVHGMRLVIAGAVFGSLGAWALTRFIRSLLYGVSPGDWITLITVTVILATTALLACWLPARRAAKLNPTEALRYE